MLNAQALASHVDRDAYDARTLSLSAGIERQSNFIWQKKWTWSLGAELIATDERDTIEATGEPRRRTFFIGALPASLGYDASDDLLDPTKGFRLLGRISPELISFEGGSFPLCADADRRQRLSPRVGHGGRWPGGSGWARSSARTATTSPRRGASTRAAAGRCAAMAISGLARATSTATRSAAAAWPNSRWKRGSG